MAIGIPSFQRSSQPGPYRYPTWGERSEGYKKLRTFIGYGSDEKRSACSMRAPFADDCLTLGSMAGNLTVRDIALRELDSLVVGGASFYAISFSLARNTGPAIAGIRDSGSLRQASWEIPNNGSADLSLVFAPQRLGLFAGLATIATDEALNEPNSWASRQITLRFAESVATNI